jgi:lysophospholipase L1-like esterase
VGDSLTVGEHASQADRTYAARLARSLPGSPLTVSVHAISGGRLDDLLRLPLAPGRRLVVVELGTNDWLGYLPRGPSRPTPPDRFAEAYGRLLDRVVGPAAALVCLGVWAPARGRGEAGGVAADYDAVIADACLRRGGSFVSLSAVYEDATARGPAGRRTPFGMADTMHPNDTGHRRIAELVLEAVPPR